MDWGLFFKIISQVLIGSVVLFVLSAVCVGVIERTRGR